jgi:hypothetical protein
MDLLGGGGVHPPWPWPAGGLFFMIKQKIIRGKMRYRKPPTISPGLIYFRKRFLMGLYKGGLIYRGAYTWTIFCVSNKQVRHKQEIEENKHVLSSDYWAYINSGDLYSGGLYSGGLIFGGAYIWNEVSVSTCGRLIDGGAYIRGGGLIVGGLR